MEPLEETRPFGQRLLNNLLDERAKRTPNRVFAEIPAGQTLEDGFRPLSYPEMANAVNVMAHWLKNELDKQPDVDRNPIPYIGPNDLRYILFFLAAQKIGRASLIPLRYNSPEAQVSLIAQSRCNHLFSSTCSKSLWQPTLTAFAGILHSELPPVEFFLHHDPVPTIPMSRTWDEAKHENMWIIQSSGTTGAPKILPWTFEAISLSDACQKFDDKMLAPTVYHRGSRIVMALDLSWGAAILIAGCWPLWFDIINVFLPIDAPSPMSADYLYRAHKIAKPSIAFFIPTLLREIVRDKDKHDIFSAMETVTYGGAPLDVPTGDIVATMTNVRSFIGATEVGMHPQRAPSDPPHWSYLNFAVSYDGFELRPFIISEQIYEMIIVKQGPNDTRPCFLVHPDSEIYNTNELWQQHPTEKGWYRMVGRADDFVKLSSMTKFNAAEIERWLCEDSHVESCLIGGDERSSTFVIIQPKEKVSREEFLDRIWETVEKVNGRIFTEARIRREFVITAQDKSIVKTAKDTVGRRATFDLFKDEIDSLYRG